MSLIKPEKLKFHLALIFHTIGACTTVLYTTLGRRFEKTDVQIDINIVQQDLPVSSALLSKLFKFSVDCFCQSAWFTHDQPTQHYKWWLGKLVKNGRTEVQNKLNAGKNTHQQHGHRFSSNCRGDGHKFATTTTFRFLPGSRSRQNRENPRIFLFGRKLFAQPYLLIGLQRKVRN